MTYQSRATDPTKLPVQMNIKIPWDFREFLRLEAHQRKVSLNELVREALNDKFAREFKAANRVTAQ